MIGAEHFYQTLKNGAEIKHLLRFKVIETLNSLIKMLLNYQNINDR